MTESDIEEALIAWGRVYGKGRDYDEDRSLTGQSSFAQWVTVRPKQDGALGRSGVDRRVAMGLAAGVGRVPMWACDPIRATQTRSFRPDYDRRETTTMDRVQSAWLGLWRACEAEATALRLHYQRRDLSREAKAKALGMTVRGYREAVASGKAHIYMALSDG